ncbi:MAG TPA: YhdP family protein [Nevskiaceae bacterium]|nr:YhdP family protein [Nevskiaceae bacterium]
MARRARRWWQWVLAGVATLVVLAAALSALFTLTLAVTPTLRERLQARVSHSLGASVAIGAMHLSWRDVVPTLVLKDVSVRTTAGARALHLNALRLGPDLRDLLRGELQPARVTVTGLQLTVVHDPDGHWRVRGLRAGRASLSPRTRELLDGLAELRLRDASVTVVDPRISAGTQHFGLNATLRRGSGTPPTYRLEARVHPPAALADQLRLSATLHGPLATPQHWHGSWRVQMDGVRDVPWLDAALGGQRRILFDAGRLDAHGDFAHGAAATAQFTARATAIAAVAAGHTLANLAHPTLSAKWQAQPQGWELSLATFSAGQGPAAWTLAPADLEFTRASQAWTATVRVNEIPIQALEPWLKLWPVAARMLQHWPGLHGRLLGVAASFRHATDAPASPATYRVQATLDDIGWPAQGDRAGLEHLDGQLDLTADGGQLRISGAPTLDAPRWFFGPVALDQLTTTIAWQRAADAWVIQAKPLTLGIDGLHAHGQLALTLPAATRTADVADARLNLDLRLKAVDAARLKSLMPRLWSPRLRTWLAKALVKAPVPRGHLVIDGRVRDFPYAGPAARDGHWQLDLATQGATLHFDPQWPAAKALDATLHFENDSMDIEATTADIDKVHITHASAVMPELHDGDLSVKAQAQGDLAGWYALLRASPLHAKLHTLVDESSASGPAQAQLKLVIPLTAGTPIQAHGDAQFNNVQYQDTALGIPVQGLHGRLAFDTDGLTALKLAGHSGIVPLTATLAAPHTLRIAFRLDPAADPLVARYLPPWLRSELHGPANWQLELPLRNLDAWTLTSDLVGTAVDLPAPFAKTAADPLPLSTAPTAAAGTHGLRIDGGLRFGVQLRYGSGGDVRGVGLRIGDGAPVSDAGHGLRIGGHAAAVDVRGLVPLVAAARRPGTASGTAAAPRVSTLPLLGAQLAIGELRWGEATIANVVLTAQPTTTGLQLHFSGPNSEGEAGWNRSTNAVQARFTALHAAALQAPTTTAHQVTATPRPALDPGTLPTLDLQCADCRIGSYPLGHVTLETARTPGGQKIVTAQLGGGDAGATLRGDWTRTAGQSSARVGFALTVRRVGSALHAFGFARTVKARDAELSGSVRFPPAPTGLALAQITGQVALKLDHGQFTAVRPGIGRVFGLFNLYALPRRLLLNFHDVADKGLAFDHVTAHFKLGDGAAVTHDAQVEGTAMNIAIAGRIGLAARDLDETVTVYPKISSGVTLGALLLGGPIAGGVALIGQQLFGPALSHLTELRYRVTGSWNNPKVQRVDALPSAPATADTPYGAGSSSQSGAPATAASTARQ